LVNGLVEEAEVWSRIGVEFVPQEQGVEDVDFRVFHPAAEPVLSLAGEAGGHKVLEMG
jgi:hypothetical protein